MKPEPRPAIHLEKPLLTTVKLGGMESLGISREGQTVFVRLMESQIWQPPAGSVALPAFLSGTAFSQIESSHLDARTLHFLPACHWCLSSCYPSAGAQRESV